MLRLTCKVDNIRCDGGVSNGRHSESNEVLGTSTPGNCTVVFACMEIVGENKGKKGRKAQGYIDILKLFEKVFWGAHSLFNVVNC